MTRSSGRRALPEVVADAVIMTSSMFAELQQINARPEPFSRYTAADLWTDPHTSERMLAYHLNGDIDVSSRNTAFIERSVAWIAERFGVGANTTIADFGCGPGLYAQPLATLGAQVTGIDFSARSLEYAREQARQHGTAIDYVQCNYLDFSSPRRFDLVLLIMCDFCALGPVQRQQLLRTFGAHLRPGGAVLLDVYSLRSFEQREEAAAYALNQMDGFWSAEPYYGFANTFKYGAEKVILDKYTLVSEGGRREVFNWLQHFDPASLTQELERGGFTVEALLADVAGGAYVDDAPELAVIARPRER